MDIRKTILAEVAAFTASRKMAESTLGNLAFKDSRLVERIRQGTAQIRSVEKLREYMEQNIDGARPAASGQCAEADATPPSRVGPNSNG